MNKIRLASVGAGLLLAAGVLAAPATANAATATPDGVLSVGTCTTVKAFSAPGGKQYTAPVTAGGSRDCRLEQGNQSSAVTRLQQELRDGCDGNPTSIAVDGQFGPATKSALQAAQRTLGISADGIYGSQTASKFAWLTTDGNLCYTRASDDALTPVALMLRRESHRHVQRSRDYESPWLRVCPSR